MKREKWILYDRNPVSNRIESIHVLALYKNEDKQFRQCLNKNYLTYLIKYVLI